MDLLAWMDEILTKFDAKLVVIFENLFGEDIAFRASLGNIDR